MTQDNYLGRMFRPLLLLYWRLRHPVSLPEDIAADLGITLSNFLTDDEIVDEMTSSQCCPTRLKRLMSRTRAEAAFHSACRCEKFTHHTLYSYYFRGGWVEIFLKFDDKERLRRLYVNHRAISQAEGYEMNLPKAS